MKKRNKITQRIEYYDRCNICGKEIKGTKESQVAFLMDVHKKSKNCKTNN